MAGPGEARAQPKTKKSAPSAKPPGPEGPAEDDPKGAPSRLDSGGGATRAAGDSAAAPDELRGAPEDQAASPETRDAPGAAEPQSELPRRSGLASQRRPAPDASGGGAPTSTKRPARTPARGSRPLDPAKPPPKSKSKPKPKPKPSQQKLKPPQSAPTDEQSAPSAPSPNPPELEGGPADAEWLVQERPTPDSIVVDAWIPAADDLDPGPADAPAPAPSRKPGPAALAPAERRKPGRPPSKPPAPVLVQRGVVDVPENSDNRLEFVYGDPTIFKALFAYFKSIMASEIHLRARPDGLAFFARDHTKNSRVVALIAGQHVNWYYAEGPAPIELGIKRDTVEKMFAAIDKTFYKITILQTRDDPDHLSFVFKDCALDKECNYKVSLSRYAPDEELYEAERAADPATLEATFPVEFSLSAKQFKKTISDASAHSDTIDIEKFGAHPLQLTYSKAAIKYHEVYRSPEKIRLRSAVEEGGSFRCTVKIDNIKSLASSMVTEDTRILCREDGDILFRSAIDSKALVVSTLTRRA